MKPYTKILLLLLLPHLAMTQDTTITISPKMADPVYNIIRLGDIDGWIFKKGDDQNWAEKDINIAEWEKMRPSKLSKEMADKNGRLECWFRIKFKLDTAFRNIPLYLVSGVWGASDVYIDEKLLVTFGNTGANDKPFKEPKGINGMGQIPVPFADQGKEHILAIHFVDFISPLPPHQLKSQDIMKNFVVMVTHEGQTGYVNYLIQNNSYRNVWLVVNAILSLLFWLLAFQNPVEKNLSLIALTSTIILLFIYCDTYSRVPGGSYASTALAVLATPILVSASLLFIMMLMLRIFSRRLNSLFKVVAVLILLGGGCLYFFKSPFILILQISLAIFVYSYCIVTSWKTLKGAQWAIVTGFFAAVIFGLISAVQGIAGSPDISAILRVESGIYLTIPLSLLAYVAMRFKEIITEVRTNAKQIVQLSEEKKQQAVNQQKMLQEEVNRQTAELRSTLDNLKSTQAQLIQSEKMASLGELTAGIAHEIQNPLNFVNNFSEVNSELIDELQTERSKVRSERDDALEDEIINDLKQNLEKINQHGKRADAIVKGMLQHSRQSPGKKEPTDINALAAEYLRLSYHGMRAKDKSFTVETKSDFDNNIEKINIVPQDIGRVLLNFFNNAFYAVNERRKTADELYQPTVLVSTKKVAHKIAISVKDNGNGIPQSVVGRIFQPFFTTKPAGQGTGLGLSLSYDIIKVHGGEIRVETTDGEGSEFTIWLPV